MLFRAEGWGLLERGTKPLPDYAQFSSRSRVRQATDFGSLPESTKRPSSQPEGSWCPRPNRGLRGLAVGS